MIRRLAPLLLAAVTLTSVGCTDKNRQADARAEAVAREEFGRAVAIDAGAGSMLGVASRADVLFEEGFSIVSYNPADDFRKPAFRWMGQRGHVRVHSHGNKAMHLKVTGWLHEKVIRARGVVTVYLDGQRVGDTLAVEDGGWGVETVVPATILHDAHWLDVIITVSAVAYHWSDPPELRVVVVNGFEWYESP